MPGLLSLIREEDGNPTLQGPGIALSQVEAQLRAGQPLRTLGLGPIDLVAALARIGLGSEDIDGPSLSQVKPTRPWLADQLGLASLSSVLPEADPVCVLTVAAGLLQIHDFWESSHEAAQEAEDRGERKFSAYWHGIAHRREPDAGNATYWFRRVGRHPLFPELGRAALRRIEASPAIGPWTRKVVAGGNWDPFVFIEACGSVSPDSEDARLARRLQRLEMDLLLGATLETTMRGTG